MKRPRISIANRKFLEDEIERLIAILDLADPDPDLEDNGDREPYLAGSSSGIHCDAEGDTADDEPSLGSLDRAIDQRRWNECECINGANDFELDRADYEDGADHEPLLGWSNPLGARVDGQCRLIVESVPTKRVRRPEVRP